MKKASKSLELADRLTNLADLHTRMAQSGYPIRVQADLRLGQAWDGQVKASVTIADLGVTDIRGLLPLLEDDAIWANWLGDALLASHLIDFEKFVASLPPECYEKIVGLFRHRCYGLTFLPWRKPIEAVFSLHISRVRDAINDELNAAAAEGGA
jgi:hypothetical protein